MNKRKLVVFLVCALSVSILAVGIGGPKSWDQQLIKVVAAQKLGGIDKRILQEPYEIQALLIDFSDDLELVLKAWISIERYGDQAREVLLTYGEEPTFKEILKDYGEGIIPVIKYFMEHQLLSLTVRHSIERVTEKAKSWFSGMIDKLSGKEAPQETKEPLPTQPETMDPRLRGLYAIQFIKEEGHHFLGQFSIDKNGKAHWIQVDRVGQAALSLFTSGLRNLEAKIKVQEEISSADVFWAGVDVLAIGVTATKIYKMAKLSRAGAKITAMTKGTVLMSRAAKAGQVLGRVLKWGRTAAILATGYVLVTNPNLLVSFAGNLAEWLEKSTGIPAWLVQTIFLTTVGFVFLSIVWPFLKIVVWLSSNILSLVEPAKRRFPARSQKPYGQVGTRHLQPAQAR